VQLAIASSVSKQTLTHVQQLYNTPLTCAAPRRAQHPSLSAFTAPLTLLQLRLALAVHKPVKFIRTSLKRLLASVSAPQGSTNLSNTNNLSATIQALAFSARLEPTGAGAGGGGSSSDSLAAWRSVRELAAAGDGGGTMMQQPHVWVVAALAETRSVLMTGGLAELSTAIQLLDALHPYLGVDDSPPPPPAPSSTTTITAPASARTFNYPKALKVLYRFLYCLVKMQTGHVKEAKAMLKSAHRLLDLEEEEDPVEGRAEPDRVRVSGCLLSFSLWDLFVFCTREGGDALQMKEKQKKADRSAPLNIL
jgi:hypothetical protein